LATPERNADNRADYIIGHDTKPLKSLRLKGLAVADSLAVKGCGLVWWRGSVNTAHEAPIELSQVL
jgi:hypothetical protein